MSEDFSYVKFECEALIARAARAYRYLMGTIEYDDGWRIVNDVENMTGVFHVVSLDAENVANEYIEQHWEIEDASYEGSGCPQELYDLVYKYALMATDKVASRYEFDGFSDLREWGAELLDEYAQSDGVQWPGELGIQAMLAVEKEGQDV